MLFQYALYYDLNWAYSQLDFTSWNLWWRLIDFEWLLNHKWHKVILIDYLMKIAFDLCITSLCEMCECAEVYMHIWYCNGCYCTINNRALDCRTVKEEGPFRANVVEGLAFKCAWKEWCLWWPVCYGQIVMLIVGMVNTC